MCPICGRDAAQAAQNASFPFCSRPCKLVDLGRWLDGAYRVPGPPLGESNGLDGSEEERSQSRDHDEEKD